MAALLALALAARIRASRPAPAQVCAARVLPRAPPRIRRSCRVHRRSSSATCPHTTTLATEPAAPLPAALFYGAYHRRLQPVAPPQRRPHAGRGWCGSRVWCRAAAPPRQLRAPRMSAHLFHAPTRTTFLPPPYTALPLVPRLHGTAAARTAAFVHARYPLAFAFSLPNKTGSAGVRVRFAAPPIFHARSFCAAALHFSSVILCLCTFFTRFVPTHTFARSTFTRCMQRAFATHGGRHTRDTH